MILLHVNAHIQRSTFGMLLVRQYGKLFYSAFFSGADFPSENHKLIQFKMWGKKVAPFVFKRIEMQC